MSEKSADFTPLSFLRTLELDRKAQRNPGINRGYALAHEFALHAIGPEAADPTGTALSLRECADVLRFLGKASARSREGLCHDDVHASRGYQALMEWLAREIRRNGGLRGKLRGAWAPPA